MWDIPIERKVQSRIAKEAYGNVLVVGYGLGIVQSYLVKNKKVKSVHTVEKCKGVMKACQKEYGEIFGSFTCLDFYKCKNSIKFDCIIGDIWEDIVPEQLLKYKKFKKHAQKFLKPNGKIFAWGKDYFEYLIKEKPCG